jgi:hypothetical protein
MTSEIRNHCLTKIKEALSKKDFSLNETEKEEILKKKDSSFLKILLERIKIPEIMEKSIYNISIKDARSKGIERSWSSKQFKDLYKKHYCRLYANISYNKNSEFVLESIKYGNFDPAELVSISSQELYPEMWDIIVENNKNTFIVSYLFQMDQFKIASGSCC